ncbi:Blue-sensitive opsin [Trichoplax sp. H2]|nr:Blue-sensitive opsin [Trichoplax sp. H2]|eukprot:RDD46411.1 Blue-sensitive opsin [Trichoplax sp. H2]
MVIESMKTQICPTNLTSAATESVMNTNQTVIYLRNIYLVFSMNFFGIASNTIIIVGTFTKKSLRKPTYYLMANLSACDILTSISMALLVISTMIAMRLKMAEGPFTTLCKIVMIPTYIGYTGSIQTLMIISFERYRAILKANKKLTSRRVGVLVVISWLASLTLASLFINSIGNIGYQCEMNTKHNTLVIIRHTILAVTHFILPAMIMIFLYSKILRRLNSKNSITRNESIRSKQLKRKTIYMLFLTTIIFLICTGPWAAALVFGSVTGRFTSELADDKNVLLMLLATLARISIPISSIYNPIIYCIYNQQIRQLFFPCCCSRSNAVHNSNIDGNSTSKVKFKPIVVSSSQNALEYQRRKIVLKQQG